jgi:hypothetical protein
MEKVKLALEDLQVESFEVEPASMGGGTVEGLQSGVHSQCDTHCYTPCESCSCQSVCPTHCNGDATCKSWNGSCPLQCAATYEATCEATCDPYGCPTYPTGCDC